MIEFIDNKLCLPASWLYQPYKIQGADMPEIMSYYTYDKRRTRKQIDLVKRSAPNQEPMISYESLDIKTKQLISARVGGDPYKVFKRNIIERYIQPDDNAWSFFANHITPMGKYLHEDRQVEYTNNARILNLFTYLRENIRSMQFKHLGQKNQEFWANMVEALRMLDNERIKCDLPMNALRLQRKWEEYKKEGYIILIHRGLGNSNKAKIKEDEQEGVLNRLMSDGRKFDNEQIAMLYNVVAGELGWKTITGGTVATHRTTLTESVKNGLTDFRNNIAMQVKRRAPQKALMYWTVDGWDVELLYQSNEDKNGYNKVNYHNRLTLIAVLDPVCKYPIGYAIGKHEDTALIKQALRNALLHVQELFGNMYRPNQLQTDNYGRGSLTETYKAMCEKYSPARVRNSKSKVIEPYFKYLNKTYFQFLPNWSGYGLNSRKEIQPNSERLNLIKKDFPDMAGCISQIEKVMQSERSVKRSKYIEAYNQLTESEKVEISYDNFLYFFGATTGERNSLASDGLNIKILGQKYTYDCFDIGFRMCRAEKWEIHFDTNNLNKVLAVNEDGTRRFLLESKYIQPMALAEREQKDAGELKRINDYNKQLEEKVMQFNIDNYEATKELIEDERISKTLTKLILTDSTGNHKDNKNVIKAKTDKIIQKQEVKIRKESEKQSKTEIDEYLDDKVSGLFEKLGINS